MGVRNEYTFVVERKRDDSNYEFALLSDEEDNEEDQDTAALALERDIDDKVQFWFKCIENRVLGAAILIVASHNDCLPGNEAKRRCNVMKGRILHNEKRRIEGLKKRQDELNENNSARAPAACRIRDQISERPKILFGDGENDIVRVNGKDNEEIDQLAEKIVSITTGRELFQELKKPIHGHIGARIPRMRFLVRNVVKKMRGEYKVIAGSYLMDKLREKDIGRVADVIDALHFLANIGEISYLEDICRKEKTKTA